ncbi:Uncharacterised protein [Salmonella enterica subsp. enterica]|nr:Uncharacterised protein [Salmonella enterica subsp. enterica]
MKLTLKTLTVALAAITLSPPLRWQTPPKTAPYISSAPLSKTPVR